ncbi:hypothetical protein HK105_205545 [Polyrhizophydium stewartii]|uniref:Beta-carotene 15,15'-dioxygenase n=1 Tax=Polyrhizophydium stewartii TaxID=2732419 RepID=A0ABR4N6A2_9FUNG
MSVQIAATCAVIVLAAAAPAALYDALKQPIMAVCVLCFGIPHGALDHIIFAHLWADSQSSRPPLSESSAQPAPDAATGEHGDASTPEHTLQAGIFFGTYFSIMCAWVIGWLFAPLATLAAFLAVSAYHFGESDLDYIHFSSTPIALAAFSSRGVLVVGLTLASDPALTLPIIQQIVDLSESTFASFCSWAMPLFVAQHAAVLLALWLTQSSTAERTEKPQDPFTFPSTVLCPTRAVWAREIARACLYVALFRLTDPLMGFSIYFGLWHALGSMSADVVNLKSSKSPWFLPAKPADKLSQPSPAESEPPQLADYARAYLLALPYSLVAITFMGMFYVVSTAAIDAQDSDPAKPHADVASIDPDIARAWAVFVMSIAVLTGPHIWIVAAKHWATSMSLDPFSLRTTLRTALQMGHAKQE